MADNLNVTPGQGAIVRAWDIGGGKLAQTLAVITMVPTITGYTAQDVTTSAAISPSVPANSTEAIITVTGAAIRYRLDGNVTAPTTTTGLYVPDGGAFIVVGATNLANLRMVAVTSTARVTAEFRRYDQ